MILSLASAIAWPAAFRRGIASAALLIALATAACSKAESAPPVTILGGPGRVPGRFVTPRAVAVRDGKIAVADRSGRLQVFSKGALERELIVVDGKAGFPLGLFWEKDGGLVLVDTHNAKVRFLDRELIDRNAIATFGDDGTPACPQRAVRDAQGRLYLTEYGLGSANRVRVFDPDGRQVLSFGGFGNEAGQFLRPIGIAVVGEEIFVADVTDRIQVFATTDGRYLRVFGRPGRGPGEIRYPYGLCAVGQTLYVAEFGNHRVQRFTLAGASTGVFGGPGQEPGKFNSPWDIAADEAGLLYVADSGNHRIVIFDPGAVTWKDGGS